MVKRFSAKRGRGVVWEWPNGALWTWIVATVLEKIFKHGTAHKLFETLAFGAIFVWAWLEIFQGRSLFRRILGAVVLIFSVYSRAR